MYAQLKHEPIIIQRSMRTRKRQGKNDLKRNIRRSKIIQGVVNLLLKSAKRKTNFLHVRDRIIVSACLNRNLIEFRARKLCRFVLKFLRILDFILRCGYITNNRGRSQIDCIYPAVRNFHIISTEIFFQTSQEYLMFSENCQAIPKIN